MNIHHEHHDPPQRHKHFGRNLRIALAASGLVFVVEVWASIRTGSLALLSDAFHMFLDLSGLLMAYAALVIASRPADAQATYGYQRAEVLAAFLNALLVLALAGFIVWRAIVRLRTPLDELDTDLVLIVAVVGLAANLVAARALHADAKENINTKGAFVNVMGDAVASVGVIAATLVVRFTGDTAWDTYVSFLVAAIIAVSAWNLLRSSAAILLEVAPPHLDLRAIKVAVEGLADVRNVHDLHIWTLTPGHHSLSMHVSIADEAGGRYHEVTHAIEDLLGERFGLEHCTIQVEPEGHDHVPEGHDPLPERGTIR